MKGRTAGELVTGSNTPAEKFIIILVDIQMSIEFQIYAVFKSLTFKTSRTVEVLTTSLTTIELLETVLLLKLKV